MISQQKESYNKYCFIIFHSHSLLPSPLMCMDHLILLGHLSLSIEQLSMYVLFPTLFTKFSTERTFIFSTSFPPVCCHNFLPLRGFDANSFLLN